MSETTRGSFAAGRFWRSRRDRITSAVLALLLALALGFFVLGRGPGSLIWLSGSRLSWLPFVGAGLTWLPVPLDWLPLGVKAVGTGGPGARPSTGATQPSGGRPGDPSLAASSKASPSPVKSRTGTSPATPTPSSTTQPTALPGTVPTTTPSVDPNVLPGATPTPADMVVTLGPRPTPTPAATPTPTPTPTAAPTATPAPAPTPTPFQPVLLFSDNFSTDLPLLAPTGWTNEPAVLLGLGGYTVVVDGSNVLKGPGGSTGFPAAIAGSSSWTDYKVGADVKLSPTTGSARVIARHQSAGNFYACGLDANQQLILGKEVGGTWSTLAADGYSFDATTWYHLELSVQGNSLGCIVTESGSGHSRQLAATATDFSAGAIGATGEHGAEYDNFVVTSLP